MKILLALFLVVLSPLQVLSQEVLFQTAGYQVSGDKVRQGHFEAVARSRTEITSTYESEYDNDIQIKFAINGAFNDMADYETNRLFFSSKSERVTSPVYVFGKRESNDFIGRGEGNNESGRTSVTIRLDMRPVLEAFKKQGYYEFYNLKRISREDFKGVYITGERPPLVKGFDHPPLPSRFALTDPGGDGVYEIKIDFDTSGSPNKARAPLATWSLQKDISHLPQYRSSHVLLDALYAMSLEEMLLNIRPDGAFMAGKLWDGVWTRDISHSILLSLAIVAPEVAKESLMRKVSGGRIIQDTGTGGSWPVSSDRMIWGVAAWEVYAVTGDKRWLNTVHRILSESVSADLKNVRAPDNLFHGESAFMDWREQSYPRWMEPRDIYQSQSLSTNAIHYQTLRILAKMAQLLGKPAKQYANVAASLGSAMNRRMWMPDKGYYGEFLYGRGYPALSPKSESLGEALSILFDIADENQQKLIIRNTPVVEYGVPSFYPQIPNMPSYHNNAIWPFVVGYWAWASAKARNGSAVEHGLGSIYRQAALFLTNKENMVAATGDPVTMLNSDRQLWSVAANLATVYRVLFGMSFEADKLSFSPFIPRPYKDTRTLRNFKYRAGAIDVTIHGYGDKIRSVTLDGKQMASATVPGDITGKHTLVITMADNELLPSRITKSGVDFAPETPVASLMGSNLTWDPVRGAQRYFIYENGRRVSETAKTTFSLPDLNFDQYQVLAVDGKGLQSFLSVPVENSSPAGKIEIEAEANKADAQNQYDGYSGKGYIRLAKAQNLVLDYGMKVSKPGNYRIVFKYANGNGPVNTENKCAIRTLRLDGKPIGAVVMPQRGNEWNNWGYSNSHMIRLTKGRHIIRIAFEDLDDNMNGAVNEALLDKIEVSFLSAL